jgi:hypothetical protein
MPFTLDSTIIVEGIHTGAEKVPIPQLSSPHSTILFHATPSSVESRDRIGPYKQLSTTNYNLGNFEKTAVLAK